MLNEGLPLLSNKKCSTMATNSSLKIKFSGTTPKGWGKKPATQPIMLELQLDASTPPNMMNEMILDGFKVKRNDRANYHPELMVRFPDRKSVV